MLHHILNSLPLKQRIFIVQNKGIFNIKNHKRLIKTINKSKENKCCNLPIQDNWKIWEKSFKKFILAQPSEIDVAITFYKTDVKCIKKKNEVSSDPQKNKKPVLICIVKDDLYRMKKLFAHYRKLGIGHFAILDNGSTDGTREYLLNQKDTDVFSTLTPYTSQRREGWINRIIAYYGINRWYLNVDSDELLIFNDCENRTIDDLISYYENKGIKRARALMIDMYSEYPLFSSNIKLDEYQANCFFDINSYQEEELNMLDLVSGGPRGRVFGQPAWLTKYPLFKFEKGDIQGKSHFQYPFIKNKNIGCKIALLHYKFLSGDLNKYVEIAKKGNYHNGSIQYKKYLDTYKKNKDIKFIYKGSKRYTNSESVYAISNLSKIDWQGSGISEK